jgi:hypothetical protein
VGDLLRQIGRFDLPAASRRRGLSENGARPQRIATLPACREKEFLALEYCQSLHALPQLYLEADAPLCLTQCAQLLFN